MFTKSLYRLGNFLEKSPNISGDNQNFKCYDRRIQKIDIKCYTRDSKAHKYKLSKENRLRELQQ